MSGHAQRKPARGRKARVTEHNRRLTRKLAVAALLMFGFGFALVPLYDVFCKITGLGGKTGPAVAEMPAAKVDTSRWVTVEFTGSVSKGMPWEFRPLQKKLRVHPGQTMVAHYYVRNITAEPVVGRAIPSVTPGLAAAHFKKIECFCFSQQTLQPGEAREMPVRFVVDAALDKNVHTITLSYTFFNTDKAQAKRYGGEALARSGHDDHAHHQPSRAPGG